MTDRATAEQSARHGHSHLHPTHVEALSDPSSARPSLLRRLVTIAVILGVSFFAARVVTYNLPDMLTVTISLFTFTFAAYSLGFFRLVRSYPVPMCTLLGMAIGYFIPTDTPGKSYPFPNFLENMLNTYQFTIYGSIVGLLIDFRHSGQATLGRNFSLRTLLILVLVVAFVLTNLTAYRQMLGNWPMQFWYSYLRYY